MSCFVTWSCALRSTVYKIPSSSKYFIIGSERLWYVSILLFTVSSLSSSLLYNSLPHTSHIPSCFGLLNSKLYIAPQSLFEHILLFTVLYIISSSGMFNCIATSTFLFLFSNNCFKCSAWIFFFFYPSNTTPFWAVGLDSLSSKIFITTSSGTSFPSDI